MKKGEMAGGSAIVPMQSGGSGLWASQSRGGHGKETSMSEPHRGDKMAGRRFIPSMVCL